MNILAHLASPGSGCGPRGKQTGTVHKCTNATLGRQASAITHIYIGQVPRIVYNPSCSEEFLALEFQKNFDIEMAVSHFIMKYG